MTTPAIRDEIDRYLHRMPNAREAYLNDPQYHQQMTWLRQMLGLIDLTLENEDIPEDIRVRVIRTVLYGGVDESEAIRRTDATRRLIAEAAKAPVLPPDLLGTLRP